jgi:hypothetical protein
LAEDEKSFVSVEGDFVVAVQAAAVVDLIVGAFEQPASRLDDKPAVGFRPGHDVNDDTGLGGGFGDSGSGVALVHPDVGDGRGNPFGSAQ